jgi:hypothetical protein
MDSPRSNVAKAGGTPEGWSKAKRRQKDHDARWTLKRGRAKPNPEDGAARTGIELAMPVFGYKSHLNIDRRHGLIRTWMVTDAAAHDSRSFGSLLDPANTASDVWADTAYRTRRNLDALQRRGLRERIQFRRPPRRPASRAAGQGERRAGAGALRRRARVRSAEHRMASFVRTVGLQRARLKIGLANLAYNFYRVAWLERRTAPRSLGRRSASTSSSSHKPLSIYRTSDRAPCDTHAAKNGVFRAIQSTGHRTVYLAIPMQRRTGISSHPIASEISTVAA